MDSLSLTWGTASSSVKSPVPFHTLPSFSSLPRGIGQEAYKRAAEDVSTTGVSHVTVQRRHFTPAGTSSSVLQEPTGVTGRPSPSSSRPFSADLLAKRGTMDTAAVVTLLALLVAMAGVSQALRIQGGLDKSDFQPGSSEENMADRLLELVRDQNHSRSRNANAVFKCSFYQHGRRSVYVLQSI